MAFLPIVVLVGVVLASGAAVANSQRVRTIRPQPPAPSASIPAKGIASAVPASSPASKITEAIGSFDSVIPAGIAASGPIGNAGTPQLNAYTLQLNTNTYPSSISTCSTMPCMGWQQFIFDNVSGSSYLYIQYWLLDHAATCDAAIGWARFTQSGTPVREHCVKDGAKVQVPSQDIADLGKLRLTALVNAGSSRIKLEKLNPTPVLLGETSDIDIGLQAGWKEAEFNVLGNGGNAAGGSRLVFSTGADLIARTRIVYGGGDPPDCYAKGYSSESSNLGFPPTPPATGPGPAMVFKQSVAASGTPADCASARSVGDTHLATFKGVFYDFQAAGDFVLAQVESAFVVQTRQVSGAPDWPDTSVNHAVATRVGKTRVALCLVPEGNAMEAQLYVDGKRVALGHGQQLVQPDPARIERQNNVYTIVGPTGDSVRAEVHPKWLGVSVGMGRWPAKVQGLLGDAQGRDLGALQVRDGAVLTEPISFVDLYGRYAESWRVRPGESLLADCGAEGKYSPPKRPLYAEDLNPDLRGPARATCIAAGVKAGPLLKACTLDVVVLKNETAARVFAAMPAPLVEVIPKQARAGRTNLIWAALVLVSGAGFFWVGRRLRRG